MNVFSKVASSTFQRSKMNVSDGFHVCKLECGHERTVQGMTGFRTNRRQKPPPKRLKCWECTKDSEADETP